ncbi:hypothetical protein E2542_SST10862 [Spatholobus suberectus]|nr:hypothetical protein E2542_SST10862 [Spatholobus suberectus]
MRVPAVTISLFSLAPSSSSSVLTHCSSSLIRVSIFRPIHISLRQLFLPRLDFSLLAVIRLNCSLTLITDLKLGGITSLLHCYLVPLGLSPATTTWFSSVKLNGTRGLGS